MWKSFTGAVLALFIAGAAAAQDAGAEIRQVIRDQIAAFRADDFETAFTYASPMIERMFGTPERFGQMVRQGYPMVWRPAEVDFAALNERGGRLFQNVLVTDSGGQLHVLEYEMVQTDAGWEINGVRVIRAGALGA